jgi:D-3-phosphoglycerate dehydrogenase
MSKRPHGATSIGASSTVDDLVLDLLEWIGPGRRPYAETMEAWRTSCPRLPVWEDATDLGFIKRHRDRGEPAVVTVSASGVEHLRRHRNSSVRR